LTAGSNWDKGIAGVEVEVLDEVLGTSLANHSMVWRCPSGHEGKGNCSNTAWFHSLQHRQSPGSVQPRAKLAITLRPCRSPSPPSSTAAGCCGSVMAEVRRTVLSSMLQAQSCCFHLGKTSLGKSPRGALQRGLETAVVYW